MKAYISPSVADDEQNILSALSKKIREGNGITLVSGYHKYGQNNSELAFHEISKSNLFIGLIVGNSTESVRVYNEWQYALRSETPALLLIEDTVNIDAFPLMKKHPDVIRFDRSSQAVLNKTMQLVRAKSDAASNRAENSHFVRETAWFLGGPVALTFLSVL